MGASALLFTAPKGRNRDIPESVQRGKGEGDRALPLIHWGVIPLSNEDLRGMGAWGQEIEWGLQGGVGREGRFSVGRREHWGTIWREVASSLPIWHSKFGTRVCGLAC